jgi:hypothetical protein
MVRRVPTYTPSQTGMPPRKKPHHHKPHRSHQPPRLRPPPQLRPPGHHATMCTISASVKSRGSVGGGRRLELPSQGAHGAVT